MRHHALQGFNVYNLIRRKKCISKTENKFTGDEKMRLEHSVLFTNNHIPQTSNIPHHKNNKDNREHNRVMVHIFPPVNINDFVDI